MSTIHRIIVRMKLTPASDVVITNEKGELLRVEPALTTLPKGIHQSEPRRTISPRTSEETRPHLPASREPHVRRRTIDEVLNATPDPRIAFHLYTDGACVPNPGPASIGAVLKGPGGDTVREISRPIGEATNNIAEYLALIEGLKMALSNGVRHLIAKADSRLIVNQVTGSYPKTPHLRPLRTSARGLIPQFEALAIRHVPRNENLDADALAARALRQQPSANTSIRVIKAPEAKDCRWCGFPVTPGETIHLMSEGKLWVCEACATQMQTT